MAERLNISAIRPDVLAKILATAYGERISVEEVQTLADEYDLLSSSGTINLIEFAAACLRKLHDD